MVSRAAAESSVFAGSSSSALHDALRCWCDEREFGQLKQKHKLYAALSKCCLVPDEASRQVLEDATLQLARESTKQPTATAGVHRYSSAALSAAANTIDRLFTADCKPPDRTSTKYEDVSLNDALSLASELKISNEAISKRLADGQQQRLKLVQEKMLGHEHEIAMLKQQIELQQRQLEMNKSNGSANAMEVPMQHEEVSSDQNTSATEPNKYGKFKSAMQQFTSEGGKLSSHQLSAKAAPVAATVGASIGSKRNAAGNQAASGSESTPLPPELASYDRELVERIEADILHRGQPVTFDDISGLSFAKKCVTELICWPMTRPDLFQGLRALPKGVLLFGPPGTGKTLIGKAIAHQSGATFFSISASSLMSKWIGEGEKTVRTLFAVAAYRQPSVVFVDEVDSLLSQRSADENEASRRMKTEFMVQLDGAGTDQSARVVIVGATNRPEELDEAVRRRFVKRIYIPLPDAGSRRILLTVLLAKVAHQLTGEDMESLVVGTDGFSGADIRSLCTEAAMGPVREVALSRCGDLKDIDAADMPPVTLQHFHEALEAVTASVSSKELHRYITWNETYGSFRKASGLEA